MSTKRPAEDQTSESPAEMAERVHQVISVIAEAVLKLAHKRFGMLQQEQASKDGQEWWMSVECYELLEQHTPVIVGGAPQATTR